MIFDLWRDEFDQVTINLRERTLSVTTEPIDLEGLELGPFSILLDWNRLSEHGSYRIVAEYPNPAHSNEEVTHPHVHDERLCEGGGHLAIRQSLQEGRLLDFFILVRQVLRTYNQARRMSRSRTGRVFPVTIAAVSRARSTISVTPANRRSALTVRILVTTAANAVVAVPRRVPRL